MDWDPRAPGHIDKAAPAPAPSSAPEPLPLPDRSRPFAPAPTPVTGVDGSHRSTWWIALLVLLALAACGVTAVYATRSFVGSIGRTLSGGPLADRVKADYAGYRVESYRTEPGTFDGVATADHVFTLRNLAEPRFELMVVFTAPSSETSDPAAFNDLDHFFAKDAEAPAVVDSFIAAWVRDHANDLVGYVDEIDRDSSGRRHFSVGFVAQGGTEGWDRSATEEAVYDYDPTMAAWTVGTTDPSADLVEDPLLDTSEAAAPVVEPPSFDDTEKPDVPVSVSVKKNFPAFSYLGLVRIDGDSSGTVYALLRHRTYPGMLAVLDEFGVEEIDTWDDTAMLISAKGTRGTAFARAWAKAHKNAVIWAATFDPDYEEDRDTVDISYFPSLALFKNTSAAPEKARWHWDEKSGTWGPKK